MTPEVQAVPLRSVFRSGPGVFFSPSGIVRGAVFRSHPYSSPPSAFDIPLPASQCLRIAPQQFPPKKCIGMIGYVNIIYMGIHFSS